MCISAQQRETFTLQRLIDNPLLTCIKSVPKSKFGIHCSICAQVQLFHDSVYHKKKLFSTACPAGTWKTFTCTNCDPSKIMVTPGTKGECTIMCDRGYRLVVSKYLWYLLMCPRILQWKIDPDGQGKRFRYSSSWGDSPELKLDKLVALSRGQR